MNQELINFIQQQLQQGALKDQITQTLLSNGWQQEQINQAFNQVESQNTPANTSPSQPTSDMFLEPSVDYQLKSAWLNFKSKAIVLITITAITAVVLVIIRTFIAPYLGLLQSGNSDPSTISKLTAPGGFSSILLSTVFGLVLIAIVVSLNQISLITAISTSDNVLDSIITNLKKILSYWWIAILSFILILGGFFLFIIPGIIFSVWFTFVYFILVNEGVKGFQAILRSKEYVKGYWFSVLLRTFFTSLLGIVMVLPTILISLISILLKSTGGGIGATVFSIILEFLASLMGAFALCFMFEVYKGIRLAKPQLVSATGKKKLIGIALAGYILLVPILIGMFYIVGVITANAFKTAQNSFPNQPVNLNSSYPYPTATYNLSNPYPTRNAYPTVTPLNR